MHGLESVSQQLNMAWSELAVMERLFPRLPGIATYRKRLRAITRDSNALLFQVVDDLSYAHSDGKPHDWSAAVLQKSCEGFLDALLAALQRDAAREPALAGN